MPGRDPTVASVTSAKGATVRFGIRHAEHHLFSATTGLRLPE